jgi:hypothetical protein
VYNAANGRLTLYVNSIRQGTTATDTTPFVSTGSLAIGRGKASGKDTDWFPGQINDVEVFGQALTAAQVRALP